MKSRNIDIRLVYIHRISTAVPITWEPFLSANERESTQIGANWIVYAHGNIRVDSCDS